MKKIALFVEGLTEQLFAIKYITEVFGGDKVAISSNKITGGNKCEHTIKTIRIDSLDANKEYFVLIYDCGGESTVKSYILNQKDSLFKSGYSQIIGFLDVFPNKISDLENVRKRLYYGIPQKPIAISIILSIMEIESWFLSESSHFSRIDSNLDCSTIFKNLGFNPEVDDIELRENPAKDLHECYQIVGMSYTKTEKRLIRTINALDFGEIYFNLPERVTSLKEFKIQLDDFFQ